MTDVDEVKIPTLMPGTYRHNKTGNLYEVMGTALDVEQRIAVVVYKPLYENTYELFVRPLEIFIGSVELGGTIQPRFERL